MNQFQDTYRRARGETKPSPPQFLMIWFTCCKAYRRIYKNAAGTAYEGNCPRCGAKVRAGVGPDGSSRRLFETR